MSESKPKKPSVQADRPNQAGQQEQSNCGNQADQLSSSHVQALPSHTALNLSRQNGSFARAPYNFVPLPNRVVPAQAIPDHDRYQGNTGWIDCELEALTPLYVRGMLKTTTFVTYGDTDQAFSDLPQPVQEEIARFFNIHERLVIPGSSLRGMIRTLVEIITFSKVGPVDNTQRLFYRAVAAPKNDPLGNLYKQHMKPGQVRAGYVQVKAGADGFWIRPPVKLSDKVTFIQAKEIDKQGKSAHVITTDVNYKPLNAPDYKPQYVKVSFSCKTTPKGRLVADKVSEPGSLSYSGWLVCTGNMAETGHGKQRSPRRNHNVVPEPDTSAELIPIPQIVVQDYLAALTDFQKEEPFDPRYGCLMPNRPVFYLWDGSRITAIGHTPNFRLPFLRPGERRASTALDFVPAWLRDENITDMAEAMFGYVKSEQMPYGKSRAYAGRVFFSDAVALPRQGKLMSDSIVTPQILSSPKPSTFQHYLVQPDEAAQDRAKLKHYASDTPSDTVIRGHKLYWHRKGIGPQDYAYQGSPQDREKHKKQLTGIQPVRPGSRFAFRVYFKNLTDEELGALLWALELPAGCAHKLGMGKPLGLGSARVKVTSLRLTDRLERYRTLFSNDQWSDGAHENADISTFKRYFEKYILDQIAQDDLQNAKSLAEIPRIRELLCLLSFDNTPPVTETRYMTIEPTNEYAERPVLPLPSTVLSSNRNLANLPGMSSQTTLRPAAAQPESKQKPSVLSSSQTTQQTVVATLLTVPNNRSARIRLASGIELDCSGFSPMAQNKPGSQCRVRLITDPNGQPLSAEFAEWLQS